ncbi:FtsX-like permease family protein [Paenibacillus sp. KN14-4R]|uniref:FtsX-like permease family protein n=1 Tax=Paenibacillus sp. KN14-4R TaxID=3445773 RepID=UPI003F9F7FFD
MIRFIWSNWWRHKQRFILLLVGILIISSGLTFLSTLTESNFGTVSETLEKKWKASYDIVVRPPGTRSVTEEDQLFEPNFLSGIDGGISVQQYETVKKITDVDIAAPLAVVGYLTDTIRFEKFPLPSEKGIYRITNRVEVKGGMSGDYYETKKYFNKGVALPEAGKQSLYGVYNFSEVDFSTFFQRLLVGIDPEQEARLVGLDKAIIGVDRSRYFNANDTSTVIFNSKSDVDDDSWEAQLPILVSSQPFVDENYTIKVERLDLPLQNDEQVRQTMGMVKEKGGEHYLNTVKAAQSLIERSNNSAKAYEIFTQSLTGIDPSTGKKVQNVTGSIGGTHWLMFKPSALQMDKVTSPFGEKWPNAYRSQPVPNMVPEEFDNQRYVNSYRDFKPFVDPKKLPGIIIHPNWVGIYDPGKLRLSKDPASETPLETYRVASAKHVLDENGKPVNPPESVSATYNPLGLLTSPPTMLTTIDGATKMFGDKAISAIRVKVAGITDISEESQAKAKRVAEEIERQTGLIADVLLGSSPHPTLIQVPTNGDIPAVGWIEQTWMKIGEVTGLFQETQMGFSIIMLLILLVAVLYVQATQLVSLFMRRKEFAVLLAVGWRPARLKRMIVQEAAILGLFAAAVSGIIGVVMHLYKPDQIALSRIALFAGIGLVVYLLGSIWPTVLAGRIKPYETMRTGEITKQARRLVRTRGMFTMALNHFLGKIGRYSLSIVSIALPTALLVLLLFITSRLKGILYTSWIGQYISVQIGPQHYAAVAVTLMICILSTGEIVWQNVNERRVELFLLKAIGWRSGAVRKLILLEGWICGLLAGLIGYGIGLLFVWYMYNSVSWSDALTLLPICALPMLVGLLSAWIPAEFAVRGFPVGSTQTIYSSSKRTERLFFAIATAVGVIVLVIGGKLAYDYVPKLIAANASKTPAIQTNLIKENTEMTIGELKNFQPQPIPNGNKAAYDLSLEMEQSGRFHVKATIDVTNVSSNSWDKLVFYMIPNMFTAQNKTVANLGEAELRIKEVRVNGAQVTYDLHLDTLAIPVSTPVRQNEAAKVEIVYDFTMPEPGYSFSKVQDNYYLGQFYPMLAAYNGGWIKHEMFKAYTTHMTDFSDFTVRYQLPDGYTLVSSADDETAATAAKGQLDIKKVRELFIAIVKDMVIREQKVGSTEVRVIGKQGDEAYIEKTLDEAVKAMSYFEQTVGLYPRKQLDIIRDGSANEYPGIITVGNFTKNEQFMTLLHGGIARQWFYGIVSSDPDDARFLSSGFAELMAGLYRMDHEKLDENASFQYMKQWKSRWQANRKPANLPTAEYETEIDVLSYSVSQPALKMWELFTQYNGIETAKAYLKAFYSTYGFKTVDTKEFVRFTKAYFLMQDDKFFESWLKL